jgi:hypothetical protein
LNSSKSTVRDLPSQFKPKPTIEDIIISKENLERLNMILTSNSPWKENKAKSMRMIAGGPCFSCGAIPNKILKYQLKDAMLIERYCDECFKRVDNLGNLNKYK